MNDISFVPEANTDPIDLAYWILFTSTYHLFPLTEQENDILRSISNKRYTDEPVSVFDRYEIVIIYWQLRGFLRKKG